MILSKELSKENIAKRNPIEEFEDWSEEDNETESRGKESKWISAKSIRTVKKAKVRTSIIHVKRLWVTGVLERGERDIFVLIS